jgi:hypothetical protein
MSTHLARPFTLLLLAAVAGCASDDSQPTASGEHTEAVGITPIGNAVTWVSLGLYTNSTSLAAVDVENRVYGLYRGSNGLLQVAPEFTGPYAAGGSPVLTTDAITAVFDAPTRTLYVAARTTGGQVAVGHSAAPWGAGNWVWEYPGYTDGAPSITTGCGAVRVAVRYANWTWTTWKSTTGTGGFASWLKFTSSSKLPVLATNSWGDAGLALIGFDQRVHFWDSSCGSNQWPNWVNGTTLGQGGVLTGEQRPTVTAYGPLFGVAIRGTDGFPYFLQRRWGLFYTTPSWLGEFELIMDNHSFYPTPVMETPAAFQFRGLTVIAVRDTSEQMIYWIRNPNQLQPQPNVRGWIGSRIVSGWGVGAVQPVMVASRRVNHTAVANPGQVSVPEELYVITRGIGDQQFYGINLGRFLTIDVLENLFNMRIDTNYVGNGVAKNNVPALFEELLSFFHSPSQTWDAVVPTTSCQYQNDNRGETLFPNLQNGAEYLDCCCVTNGYLHSNGVVIDGAQATAWRIWEEFGHLAVYTLTSNTALTQGFHDNFGNVTPRTCNVASDCGTAYPVSCIPASSVGPYSVAAVGANTGVCAVSDPFVGWRPQGFAMDYALSTDSHNMIYIMLLYRWFGDDLRDMASRDNANGEPRLQAKYDWLYYNVYDQQQFRGRRQQANTAATSDEGVGTYGMPVQ